MAKLQILAGTTSKLIDIFAQDSSVATGAGLTGLVFNTASLTAYYYREGAASAVSITLATMTLGTWATGGFIVVDGTNMPGAYQLGVPNAALAAGAKSALIMLKGATNLAPVVLEIELLAIDNQDAVRGGLTALPNAAAGATNGLACLVAHGGTAQAGAAGTITLAAGASATNDLYKGDEVAILAATGGGQCRMITSYVGATKVATVDWNWTVTPDSTSVYEVRGASGAKLDSNLKVQGVVLTDTVTTYTGNTLQTGDNFARLGAPVGASISADIAGVQADTDNLQTRIPTSLVSGRIDASVGAYQSGQAPLQPTTAGRTLDVTATGEAGIDWANIGAPTTAQVLSGTTVGVVTALTTNNDKTGYTLTATESLNLTTGTASAGGASTITLVAPAVATASLYVGAQIKLVGGTGTGQVRTITAYTAGRLATVDWPWIVTPDGTSVYAVLAQEGAALNSTLQVTSASVQGNVTGSVASVTGAVGSVAGNVGGNVVGSVASVTGNVAGNVTGSVGSVATGGIVAGSFAAGAIDATAIATDAIGSAELAASAVTEIQTGLATSASIATLQADTDDIQTRLPAALVSGRMDSSVGAVAAAAITNVAFAAGAIDAAAIATDAIGSAELAASGVSEIAGAVWDELTSSHLVAGSFGQSQQIIRNGTAQAGGATSITLDAGASAVNSFYNNTIVEIVGGTGVGQARFITAYVGATKVATVQAWATNPDATSVFLILPFDSIPGAVAPTASQNAAAVWDEVRASHVAAGSFGQGVASVQGNVTGSVGSVTGSVGSVATGGIVAGSFAAGAIDAAAIATDAIGSAELAASAVTEIQTGLATAAALATVQSDTDDIQTRLPAALVSGRMDSSVGAYAAGLTPLQPTVAGRTLDVAATGEAGLDFDNIKDATGAHTLTNIRVPNVTLTDTVTTYTGNTPQTGDNFARLGAPVGASIAADIAGVQADTDNIQTRLPATLDGGNIRAAVEAYASGQAPLQPTVAGRTLDVATTGEAGLDFDNIKDATSPHTLANVTVPTVTLTTTTTSVTNDVGITQTGADKVWASAVRTLTGFGTLVSDIWSNASRTLTAFAFSVTVGTNTDKTGYSLSAGGVQAIWDALTSALTTVGSIGKLLVDNINATISSRLASASYVSPPSAASISTQVWSEPIPGSFGAGSAGGKLNSVAMVTDPWNTALPGSYPVGSAGNILASRPTAAQIDTQLSGTHGAGLWGATAGSGANQVTITVETTGSVPIPNSVVTIKNALQSAVLAQGLTDGNGQVIFNLDNGSYKALILTVYPYNPLAPQTLVVSGTTSATYQLSQAAAITPATSPSLCRIYATLRKLDGTIASLEPVRFRLQTSGSFQASGNIIVVQEISNQTDANGFFFVDLTRSSVIMGIDDVTTAVYKVTATGANLAHTFSVPDTGSADLLTLTLTAV